MGDYKVISSDSHIFEPPDFWTSRGNKQMTDKLPHVVTLEDGDWWICGGRKVTGVGLGAQAGLRFEEPEKIKMGDSVDNVRPGGWIPEEHIKDMELDGVYAGVVFPSVGFMMYNVVPDSDVLSEIFRVYNDWVAEFCKPFPNRLKGIALINVDDVAQGVKELERCAKLGLVGGMIPLQPPQGHRYLSDEYEPLWSAAADLNIPLNLHVATNRPGVGQELQQIDEATAAFIATQAHWAQMSIADMIFSGVMERHPKLKIGSVELDVAWIPYFLDRIDYTYTQRAQEFVPYRFKEDMLPSDYFHRQVFVGFQEDALGVQMRDIIGIDNLMWGSDYPHPEGTFPRSRQIIDDILVDCTEEEKEKIVCRNAARMFNFQV